jgi:hypothetical protein
LPEKSEVGQQIWEELTSIGENCQGVELLMNLEDYSVLWINRNFKEGKEQARFRTRLEQFLLPSDRSDHSRRNTQTPKRLSRERNKTGELIKTVKNSRTVF